LEKRSRESYEKENEMAGKYTPLENFLRDLPVSQREVTLRFEEIERILKSTLPTSAYEDRRWWDHETEGNHVSGRAWSNAGWKIESLDVKKKWVKLIRVRQGV
jgi:hypothetical protein